MFTTNHKERLDPALMRPGRMDVHVHMSYCTPCGFKILAYNYLGINFHCLFSEIEEVIAEVEVTPAEIAEELMKSEEADIALGGVLKLLKRKKSKSSESSGEGEKQLVSEKENECEGIEEGGEKQVRKYKMKARKRRGGR